MKKELKDYLHLYLGCDMYSVPQQSEFFIEKLTGVDTDYIRINGEIEYPPYESKPILRPLSDITEGEKMDLRSHFLEIDNPYNTGDTPWHFEQTRYLLSKHFDLFGLIEAGLAIDKTTLK